MSGGIPWDLIAPPEPARGVKRLACAPVTGTHHNSKLMSDKRSMEIAESVVQFHQICRARMKQYDHYGTPEQHTCSNRCEWIETDSDCFFCLRTGNVHLCGRDVCDQVDDRKEMCVCMFTGFSWPLMLQPKWNAFLRCDVRISAFIDKTLSSSTSVQRTMLAVAESILATDELPCLDKIIEERIDFAEDVLKVRDPYKQLAWLCKHAALLYSLIKNQMVASQDSFAYRIPSHCLVVIYHIRTGYRVPRSDGKGSMTIVPQFAELRTFLPNPPTYTTGTSSVVSQRMFTTASRIFQIAINGLSTTDRSYIRLAAERE